MRRGPRATHVKLDVPTVVEFLLKVVPKLHAYGPIFDGSPSMFRRRLRQLLEATVGCATLLLPSSMRPGGATWWFQQWNEDLAKLQWRGRWATQQILRHYIQELTAAQVLTKVPEAARHKVRQLDALFEQSLAEFRVTDGEQWRPANFAAALAHAARALPAHPRVAGDGFQQ